MEEIVYSQKTRDKIAKALLAGELEDHDQQMCNCGELNTDPETEGASKSCYAGMWLDGEISSEQVILDRS